MSKWSNIYRKQIASYSSIEAFIASKIEQKKKLLENVGRYASDHKKILEVGCGSGIITSFFSKMNYESWGLDSDPDMLKLASEIALAYGAQPNFTLGNLAEPLDQTKFDVIYSNGVMEHFSNREIHEIITHHLKIATYVIFSVPSDFFNDTQKIYGNERFMSNDMWRSLLVGSGKIVEEFAFNPEPEKLNPENKDQFIGFVLTKDPR